MGIPSGTRRTVRAAAALLALLLCAPFGAAQRADAPPGRGGLLDVLKRSLRKVVGAEDGAEWDWGAQGGWLRTDADAYTLFERGRTFAADGRYAEAAIVLQRVLDTAGSALISDDRRTYRPLRAAVERLLASLPPAGLEAYRLRADGEARALLGAPDRPDAAALAQVVERYFLSRWGDDAAYRLGSLYLDEHRFAQAARLFRKVLEIYPDPSVPKRDLWLRLAVASARLGDTAGARKALASLEALVAQNAPADVRAALDAVRAEVRRAEARHAEAPAKPLLSGSLPPGGRYPPLSRRLAGARRAMLITAWEGGYRYTAPTFSMNRYMGRQAIGRRQVIKGWLRWNWLPTAQMIAQEGRLYFRTHVTLVCCDAVSGEVLWERTEKGHDADASLAYALSRRSAPGATLGRYTPNQVPRMRESLMYFGDRVGKSLTVVEGRVLCIENNLDATWMPVYVRASGRTSARRQGSTLACYDALSGRLLWRVGENGTDASLQGLRFLVAPVAAGERVLAPAEDPKGELALLALNLADGSVVWRRFLCGYGVSPAQPRQRPVGLALESGEVFVATGGGLVFALDADTGRILWAARYRQMMGGSPYPMNRYQMNYRFWDENIVLPFGRTVIVLPADSDLIARFDRDTGAPRGEQPRGNARHFVGLHGRALIVAGQNEVRACDAETGVPLWSQTPGVITGRAMLSGDSVYVPLQSRIVRLDADSGAPRAEFKVDAGADPVGNLFTDGERLYVAALERVYCLQDVGDLLARLKARIEARDDAAARLDRARIYRVLGRLDEAVADLRAAHGRLTGEAQESARQALLDGLLALAERTPARAGALLAEAVRLAKGDADRMRVRLARAALAAREGELTAATRAYIDVASAPGRFMVEMGDEHHRWQVSSAQAAAAALADLVREHPDPLRPLLEQRARESLRRLTRPAPPAPPAPGLPAGGTPPPAAPKKPASAPPPATPARAAPKPGVFEVRAAAPGDAPVIVRLGPPFSFPAAGTLPAVTAPPERLEALRGLARAYPGTRAGIEAARLAADVALGAGDVERAEVVLAQLARSPDRMSAAAGAALLANLHERQGWKRQARGEWVALAGRFRGVPVPWREGDVTAERLAARRLAALPKAAQGAAWDVPTVPAPPYRLLWSQRNEGIIEFGLETPSQFLREHLIVYRNGRPTCVNVRTGRVAWTLAQAPMGLRREPRFSYRQFGVLRMPYAPGPPAGHVKVTALGGGLAAYGLVTGRILWTQGKEDARRSPYYWQVQNRARVGRIYAVSVGPHVVAAAVSDAEVKALDLVSGEVLWTRGFEAEEVLGVRAHESWLAVVLAGTAHGTSCWICDPLTGRKIAEFPLYRDPNATHRYPVLWMADAAVFLDGATLVCRELPSGRLRWKHALEGRASRLKRFGAGEVAVLLRGPTGWSVVRVNVADGRKVGEYRAPGGGTDYLQEIVADADGRHFYTVWNRRVGNLWLPSLTVHDMAGGRKVRQLGFARRLDDATRRALAKEGGAVLEGNYVLAAHGVVPAGEGFFGFRRSLTPRQITVKYGSRTRTYKRYLWEPVFVEKATGRLRTGFRMRIPEAMGMIQYPQFMGIKGDVLVVLSNQTLMAFAHDEEAAETKPEAAGAAP